MQILLQILGCSSYFVWGGITTNTFKIPTVGILALKNFGALFDV